MSVLLVADKPRFFDQVRAMVLEVSAELYYRLELYFSRFPFKLLLLVSPDMSESEKLAIRKELFSCPECCLDMCCSLALRKWAQTPHGLESRTVTGVLTAWRDRGRVSTAHIERMHAQNKTSLAPGRGGKRISVESGAYASFCQRLMSSHVRHGHLDYSLPKNEAKFARRLGLRTRTKQHRQRYKWKFLPRNTTGNLRWRFVSRQSTLAKRARGTQPWTSAQERAARQAWAADFDRMSPQEQQDFGRLHAPPDFGALREEVGAVQQQTLMDSLSLEASPAPLPTPTFRQFAYPDIGDEVWPVSVHRRPT
jgi:hypothetical protein